jgi:hypothetical protein
MSAEEINAVKIALTEAGFTGLDVHMSPGVMTLNGSLPFDTEAMSLLNEAWPSQRAGLSEDGAR